ncbi:MAG: YciK family oxidoreductase [Endozoicomonadaceae bacterium]|nr:YciK family oxidoreductase [Endozoicomonadaceae bacterium]
MKSYQPHPHFLDNKTILVTGAGQGIGKTLAKTYAHYGAQVILLGKTVQHLEQVYDEICEQDKKKPLILPFDLNTRDFKAYQSIADVIASELKQLNGLVHNASLLGQLGPMSQYQPTLWDAVMQVNVTAQFFLTKALIALLRAQKNSAIIFTSSGVTRDQGRAHWGAYCISKVATESLAKVMSDEEKDISTLRINTINPGATRTAMRAQAYPAENPNTLSSPEEIMPLYLYLMSQDSQHITGQYFNAQD